MNAGNIQDASGIILQAKEYYSLLAEVPEKEVQILFLLGGGVTVEDVERITEQSRSEIGRIKKRWTEQIVEMKNNPITKQLFRMYLTTMSEDIIRTRLLMTGIAGMPHEAKSWLTSLSLLGEIRDKDLGEYDRLISKRATPTPFQNTIDSTAQQ